MMALLYLRLTPLGAYVLGLTSTYEAATGLQKNKLHFSRRLFNDIG